PPDGGQGVPTCSATNAASSAFAPGPDAARLTVWPSPGCTTSVQEPPASTMASQVRRASSSVAPVAPGLAWWDISTGAVVGAEVSCPASIAAVRWMPVDDAPDTSAETSGRSLPGTGSTPLASDRAIAPPTDA